MLLIADEMTSEFDLNSETKLIFGCGGGGRENKKSTRISAQIFLYSAEIFRDSFCKCLSLINNQ